MGKLSESEIVAQLEQLEVSENSIDGILKSLKCTSLDDLRNLLGSDSAALKDLESIFALADGYGIREWIAFDAGVVRGLAYYTGSKRNASISEAVFRHRF